METLNSMDDLVLDEWESTKICVAQEYLIPQRVIFSGNVCVCVWSDGTKTIVRKSDNDMFCEENAVAQAVMNRLFGSRSKFLRHLDRVKKYDKNVAKD